MARVSSGKTKTVNEKGLNMAVSKLCFNCKDFWYVQVNGLAVGVCLDVILSKLWLNDDELVLAKIPAAYKFF